MNLKKNFLWVIYFVFVAVAIGTHQGEPLISTAGPYGEGKIIAWLMLLAFLAYSIYCSAKENFFRSVSEMWSSYLWHRQIGIDLYIGVSLSLMMIYLNEGSLLILALWFLPMLIFANLATLLYVALNYQSLIAHFVN